MANGQARGGRIRRPPPTCLGPVQRRPPFLLAALISDGPENLVQKPFAMGALWSPHWSLGMLRLLEPVFELTLGTFPLSIRPADLLKALGMAVRRVDPIPGDPLAVIAAPVDPTHRCGLGRLRATTKRRSQRALAFSSLEAIAWAAHW